MAEPISWKGAFGIAALVTAAGFATTFLAQYSYSALMETNQGELIYNSIRYVIGQYISSVLALKGFSNLTAGRS